jgi:hypothetical protein
LARSFYDEHVRIQRADYNFGAQVLIPEQDMPTEPEQLLEAFNHDLRMLSFQQRDFAGAALMLRVFRLHSVATASKSHKTLIAEYARSNIVYLVPNLK